MGEKKGKDEVGAWWYDPDIPGSYHVLPESKKGKFNKRWGKWLQEGAWKQMFQIHEDGGW